MFRAVLASLAIAVFGLAGVPRVSIAAPGGAPSQTQLLCPPTDGGPVVVHARFDLNDINDINDETETFEFAGVMTLTWRDPRQAFDPVKEGVAEKILVGSFQFNEISPSWYPQVMLVNVSGQYQKDGVVLRVLPDGTTTLIETVNAVAESKMNLRSFPFDRQRLVAMFEVLGFDREEVVLRVDPPGVHVPARGLRVPQWTFAGIDMTVADRPASYAGRGGVASTLTLRVEVQRNSFYISRLVIIPLAVIVLLSFSVFWMERSSLGDRISVSFIGILTGVAYQVVISQNLPRIAYFTFIHGFVNLGFLMMCATVVVNLVVGGLDKKQKLEAGDRVDYRCRWVFPLAYFGLNGVMLAVAMFLR